jgi:hypothetical protein
MASRRLLRLKHDRNDMGFFAACLSEEGTGREPHWILRVESPASTQEFRDHLTDGSCMALNMVTRDGVQLRGDAYVSSVSDGVDTATVVVLAGAGPLRQT